MSKRKRKAKIIDIPVWKAGKISGTLSDDQRQAVETIQSEDGPFFLTGEAGSGKSFVINWLRSTYPNSVVTAMTGVAAQLINGRTLHSFASLHPKLGVVYSKQADARIRNCDLLIIDEISMASLDVFEMLHERFKYAGHWPKLLMVGDFLQLPPVEGFKLFESTDWSDCTTLKLTTQHRQNDEGFIQALNDIRCGKLTDRAKDLIASRTVDTLPDDCTHLMSHNYKVDARNKEKLDELPGIERMYKMTIVVPDPRKGKKAECPDIKKLEKSRFQHKLPLKINARVVLLTNQAEGLWVNGSTGEIVEMGNDSIKVRLDRNNSVVTVRLEREEIPNPDGSTLCWIEQIPVKLAWALTIHKSQGMTLDRVAIDMGDHFAAGQTYVAMSRCRTKEGLFLVGRLNQLIVDPMALRYCK